jgi:hypothetical protein
MGWFGYGIYGGDDTQTLHYKFLLWAKCAESDDEIIDNDWLTSKGTKIPNSRKPLLLLNVKRILKKMPKSKFWNEDDALEWQMLLSLFLDNDIKPPKIVFKKGVEATEYLIEQCSDEWARPDLRKRALRNFIKRAKKNKPPRISPRRFLNLISN